VEDNIKVNLEECTLDSCGSGCRSAAGSRQLCNVPSFSSKGGGLFGKLKDRAASVHWLREARGRREASVSIGDALVQVISN
jgi:hypothetical protein